MTLPTSGVSTGVRLPASALVVGADGTRVATLGAGGRVVMKTVTIGRDQGETVTISAGLSPSDRVIDNPPDSLDTGDLVRVAHSGS